MKTFKYWAPDGKKYEAANEQEANEHCVKMARAMKLAEQQGGENSHAEIDFDKLSALVDKMVEERLAKVAKSGKSKTKNQ